MFEKIGFVVPGTKKVVSPYQTYEGSSRIEPAQPFSVTLATVTVADDLDGILRGDNDILVLTKSSMGEQPLVERVHYYQEEVPKGEKIRNLLADSVYLADDYSGDEKLWLELKVLEIDSDTGERKAAANAFNALAASAGAVFPAIIPYTFGAASVVNLLERLVAILEKDENVVSVPISLNPGPPRPGRIPLQEGSFVAFAKPTDTTDMQLESGGILSKDGNAVNASYVVFNVFSEKRISRTQITSQRIATLLTQIQKGNKNTVKSTVEFLGQTLSAYSNYRKLERYLNLSRKDPEKLSEPERELLDTISNIEDLKPFLPQ